VLIGKRDSKHMHCAWHTVTVSLMYEPDIDWPAKSDVRTAACLLISWMVGSPHSVLGSGMPLMSGLPRHCYSGTWIEMRASFLSTWPCVLLACQVRLLLIVTATAGVSVSAETCKLMYCIHWYCTAASIHSPMSDIGLTLINIYKLVSPVNHFLEKFLP